MYLWAGLIAFGGVLISLYSGLLTWALLAAVTVLTVVLTFILPRVQRPGEPRAEDHLPLPLTRTSPSRHAGIRPRLATRPDFVLLFTSTANRLMTFTSRT